MKKYLALLLALVMVFTLAACGGNEDPAGTDANSGNTGNENGSNGNAGSNNADNTDAPEEVSYPIVIDLDFDYYMMTLTVLDEENATLSQVKDLGLAELMADFDLDAGNAEAQSVYTNYGTYQVQDGVCTLILERQVETVEYSGSDAKDAQKTLVDFMVDNYGEDSIFGDFIRLLKGEEQDVTESRGVSFARIDFVLNGSRLKALTLYADDGVTIDEARTYHDNGALESLASYWEGELQYTDYLDEEGNWLETRYPWDDGGETVPEEDREPVYEYHDNGEIKSITSFHSNGNVSSVNTWREDGTLESEQDYFQNGYMSGLEEYDENGELATVRWYYEDTGECQYLAIYESGVKRSEERYFHGGAVSMRTDYDEEGRCTGSVGYHENGVLWYTNIWEDGVYLESLEYNTDGVLTSHTYFLDNQYSEVYKYYPNGNVKIYSRYDDTTHDIVEVIGYYESGKLYYESQYETEAHPSKTTYYSEETGLVERITYYFLNGNTEHVEYYENGVLTETVYYDEEGNEI